MPLTSDQKGKQTHEIFNKKNMHSHYDIVSRSVAAFLAFQVIPGDVVRSILGTEATPEREAQLREELGLDKPPVERYISWADDVLHGDFGVSYRYSKNMNEMMPVKELIGDKLPVTLYLAVISFVMIVLVSIPLGVLWAKCGNRFLDAVFGVLTQVTMAVPSFFLGILVTYLCGIVLKWFVPGGYVSYQENMTGFLAYLLFPGDFDRFTENSDDCTLFA